jgi:hypothetical protein
VTTAGGLDGFVAKLTGAGEAVWARRLGGTGTDYVQGLSTDAAGNIYAAGGFNGTADFSGTSLTSAGATDAFIAKYSAAGALVWVRRFGGAGGDVWVGATDELGNVMVVGEFQGTVDFGGGPLTSAGSSDIVVAKYTPEGAPLWSRRFGAASHDAGGFIAPYPGGGALVAGQFQSTVDFGPTSLTSAGGYDALLLRLGP